MKLSSFLTAACISAALGGCSHVSSSTAGRSNVSGEAWYVRTAWFLGIPVSTSVWHCPAPTSGGPVVCAEARMHDQSESEEEVLRRPSVPSEPTTIYTGDGTPPKADEPAKKKKKKRKRKKPRVESDDTSNPPPEAADDDDSSSEEASDADASDSPETSEGD